MLTVNEEENIQASDEVTEELSMTQKSAEMPEEYYLFEGIWRVGGYIDGAEESIYVDTESEEYKEGHARYITKYIEKYWGYTFEVTADSIEHFGSRDAKGYYYDDDRVLYSNFRQPSTLEIAPPFLCAWVQLKELDEWFYIIIDGNGKAVLEVGNLFFELDRVEENVQLGNIVSAVSFDAVSIPWIIVLDDNGNVWIKDETRNMAVQIPEMKNVIEIVDTGESAFYALTDEGDVYAWGSNLGGFIHPEINRVKEKPELAKREELSDIVDMAVGLGSAFAVDREGKLYAWRLGRHSVYAQDIIPSLFEENQDLIGNVKEVYPGTWRCHFFKREDGSLFSIMSLEKTNAKAKTYFIFPFFSGDEPVTDWCNDERVFDIRGAEENKLVILYEMGIRDDIELLANDNCTMYMYLEDGTLWYWNNDRITYYNKEEAGASVELQGYDYNGFFEEVDIRSILGITDESVDTPKIIDICSGRHGVLFLMEDGQVFASEYVTKEVRDVDYYTFEEEEGVPLTETCYQMRLKELSFRKLEYENIISINSDEDSSFYLVDKSGNVYCYYAKGDRQF
ncbi:MAG: hypothetical protein K2J04_12050 [Lachnospiraceae bacterium]|nr:hypothetical protein [Lachnospiraceae bacterium]